MQEHRMPTVTVEVEFVANEYMYLNHVGRQAHDRTHASARVHSLGFRSRG